MTDATNLPSSAHIALMIDIETLSLAPDAFVTQVGLAVGNIYTHEIIETRCWWLGEAGQAGRRKDTDTIIWWMNQAPEVRASVFDMSAPRIDPRDLFDEFKTYVEAFPEATVWGSPAMFDMAILTSLWQGRKPWKYNHERDMMTLYKYLDPNKTLQPEPNLAAHDAASDAVWQLKYLFKLLACMDDLRAIQANRNLAKANEML
jgi:hypothetical protein